MQFKFDNWDRREFLRGMAVAGWGTWISRPEDRAGGLDLAAEPTQGPTSEKVWEGALALTQAESRLESVLALQMMEPGQRQTGGFVIPTYGFAYPAANAVELRGMAALFSHPRSRYYRQPSLASRIELAVGYLLREQYADGTIDGPTTNFHSPPDTAFVVVDLLLAYRLLEADGSAATRGSREQLGQFLRRAADAMADGGIHTPNHRWVVAAALAGCDRLFPKAAYRKRVERWLAEGIDCNEDGEYTERSNAVYNAITNRALIMLAEHLDRPEILDPVRRNLTMMYYCVHPDGEIVTDYSRRQDLQTRARMGEYLLHYRILSQRDKDGRMAAMADRILADAVQHPREISLAVQLAELMLRPELDPTKPGYEEVPRAPLPDSYLHPLPQTGVVRLRRQELSATIVAGQSRFLSLRQGGAVLEAVRVASAFFGKGQFIGAALAPVTGKEGAFRLEQKLDAAYYQPIDVPPAERPLFWETHDRERRARSHEARLVTRIELEEVTGADGRGLELSIDIQGTERIPIVVECWFRPGGKLQAGKDGAVLTAANGTTFLVSGTAEYQVGEATLRVGPGRAEHRWAQLRGAEPPLTGAIPLTLAGWTPFVHRLRIVAAS
ncbi:MAG: hypothetical protein ACOYNR_10230 [Blastocatellia bacterium]